jgi:glutathione synthase/RimK-type ligase-like ATP-grasp enzyme
VTARIALATAAEFPDLDEETRLLVATLQHRGLEAGPAIWTDPGVDWAAYDLVVVRCTWDYHSQLPRFLDWAAHVASVTRLANPEPVLRWNTDKTYLRDLTGAGLPVVRTWWLEPGDTFTLPAAGEYVVKPAVSAGSRDTNRWVAREHDEHATEHVTSLLDAGRTVMVQPYLASVDSYGETAMLFLGDRFSHAIRKGPLLEPGMEFVSSAYKEETVEPRDPTDAEREVAEAVLDALDPFVAGGRGALTYARVDLVPDDDGRPTLLELELTEPSMFLDLDRAGGAEATERFAAAIGDLLAADGVTP